MSKKMTPCEKLGYKVGDKFTVIKDSYFEKGTIVTLLEDDGSEVPWFTCGGVRRALIIGSNPDVEPTPSKLKPAKQALADAIHQNGGWGVERFMYATSNYVGMVKMFVNKPKLENANWNADGTQIAFAWLSRPLPNWHQCVLSREEYYHAYPKAGADGWIEWSGEPKSPVENGVLVDVKLKGGGYHEAELLGDASWSDAWGDESIIAYRLHKPDVKPELCKSVMRSIPEPESIDGLCAKVTEENKHQHIDAKPTIEQLAHDYRNAKDYAVRLQKEADDAKAAADAALGELERAGEEIGLLLSPIREGKKPEINIIDWRDLMVGDEIICSEDGNWNCDLAGNVCVVREIESQEYTGCMPILAEYCDASDWGDKFTFVRRP